MIQVDWTFAAFHAARAKHPLYYLEIDEMDVVFTAFPKGALTEGLATGYGVQPYGIVGYGF